MTGSEMLSRLNPGTDNGGDPAVGPREQLMRQDRGDDIIAATQSCGSLTGRA